MSVFDEVTRAPEDPILGLNLQFKDDKRATKVNLGVGAYKRSDLQPMVLSSVRKAENILLTEELDKEYLPISGDPEFLRLSKELLFGEDLNALQEGRICGVQALGGTGGLSVGAQFVKKFMGGKVYLSDPTWANHKPIFTSAGLEVEHYPYFDKHNHCLDFDKMCEAIKGMPKGSIILLHAVCHNPTGIDPTFEQWKELSALIKENGVIPFFDCAYQGFGSGIEEDAQGLRYFLEQGHEAIVSYSYSKNFGLYGERVGALFFVVDDANKIENVSSQVKVIIRRNYSNPPKQGARIVRTVLGSETLKKEWKTELKNMRERIIEMRKALASSLASKGDSKDFGFMKHQKGMFSFSGLDKDQVEQLKAEYGIYMPGSGRVNVAGLSPDNIDYVVDAMISVMQ